MARALCDASAQARLETDGFLHLEGIVPAQLVDMRLADGDDPLQPQLQRWRDICEEAELWDDKTIISTVLRGGRYQVLGFRAVLQTRGAVVERRRKLRRRVLGVLEGLRAPATRQRHSSAARRRPAGGMLAVL